MMKNWGRVAWVRAGSVAVAVAVVAAAAAAGAPEVMVERVPHGGLQPEAAIDAAGAIHLLYFQGNPKAGNVFHVRRGPGESEFSQPVRVNAKPGSAVAMGTIRGAQLALGKEGFLHVAWMGSKNTAPGGDHAKMPMLYARSTDGGRTFEPERNVVAEAYGLDGGGSVAADEAGNVHVFWHARGGAEGEEHRRVYVASSRDSGATFSKERPAWDEATGACGCCGMRAFGDRETGKVYALYRSATERVNRDMYLLEGAAAGDGFSGKRVDAWKIEGCPMSTASFSASGGRVAAAWEAYGRAVFAVWGGGGGESAAGREPVRNPESGAAQKAPAIVLGDGGAVLLVWAEVPGWGEPGEIRWRMFDAKGVAGELQRGGAPMPAWSKPAAVRDAAGRFLIFY